jgi:hypothetical protein
MALTPYNTSLLQALKWQQNNAPNITALVTQKNNWYLNYQWSFWQNWFTNVFNLATANSFGILIWCIILGVPTQLFGLDSTTYAWAYGNQRQNYINSQTPAPPDANLIGGNFAAGGQTTILNLQEARWILQLRYASLVGNGRIAYVNKMLNWIFNGGKPWNFAAGQYFYVTDCTSAINPTAPMVVTYHIGPAMGFSAQFVNLLNALQYGILPQFAGMQVSAVVDGDGTEAFSNNGGLLNLPVNTGYPASPSGLAPGAVWWNGGTIAVIPGITPNPTAPKLYLTTTTPAQLMFTGGGNLPLTPPTAGTQQLWNNGGAVCVA